MSTISPTAENPDAPPPVAAVLARLREVFGPEMDPAAPSARWWITGASPTRGVAIWVDRTHPPARKPDGSPSDDHGACVIWVTRPDEPKPERCPIVTMGHLEVFLALVSVARRSFEPVHGNVCPGTE